MSAINIDLPDPEAKAFLDKSFSRMGSAPPQATGPRAIDKVTGERTIPMRVLCLGYARTGTFGLYTALKMLGYNPYHMAAAMQNPKGIFPCWNEALEAKYEGKGKLWGREEFDKMLGRHDAVLDVPCILFVEELIKMYPDAKVILTERPVDGTLFSQRPLI